MSHARLAIGDKLCLNEASEFHVSGWDKGWGLAGVLPTATFLLLLPYERLPTLYVLLHERVGLFGNILRDLRPFFIGIRSKVHVSLCI